MNLQRVVVGLRFGKYLWERTGWPWERVGSHQVGLGVG
jgi:hypothetical protein